MTRKDFKLIAKTISRIRREPQRRIMTEKFGRDLESTNERFDWGRWYKECGVEPIQPTDKILDRL